MALPHLPEEKELTERDPETSPESSRQLFLLLLSMHNYAKQNGVQTTGHPSCATAISFIEFLLLTNLTVDCTAPLVVQ